MNTYIFHHKNKPSEPNVKVLALTLESARLRLGSYVTNPQEYKHPNESEKKVHEYHQTSGNPHGEDEHSIPDEVHAVRRELMGT